MLYVADIFDDCCYGGDSAEDGEYWDHGDSPLLRVVVLSGSFPDIQLCAKPVPKGKCDFQAKIAGWRIRTICVDGCIYKIVYRNTFSYAMQNKKGPAEAEPKICQQKRKWGSWFIVECFRPFDRLRDLVYTLLFVTLYDDFPSLTAPQGERSDRACTGIAEP